MANMDADTRGSSPAGRGGAGVYVEGELGAFYLLAMLTDSEARGLPGARIEKIRFQGVDAGYALDDIVVHGGTPAGATVLEIQSKRTATFAPRDSVFQDVCEQIARVKPTAGVAEARHLLAVATQRTSARISGAYQDVLMWARSAESGPTFFARLERDGVASQPMRDFAATFRTNLVQHGVADDDAAIWALLKRFQILEFDFESTAPLARIHAFALARGALAPRDGARAESLWANLVEIALAAAKVGGVVDLTLLRGTLQQRGFKLAGDRDFAPVRAKLEEMSRSALADIGTSVGGIHIPRIGFVEAIDTARDGVRMVEIRGGPGVGKSSVFRQLAERVAGEARIIVLDPINTPDGGVTAFALQLGFTATVQDLLTDLAASGGGVLFIDNLDMFTTAGKRRTVNDLLRTVSGIPGFAVVATARADFGRESDSWLAADALEALGPPQRVEVAELDEAEIALLRERAPALRALLAPGHPAASVARNLYRLSRLLAVPDTATIRSEAALAAHWWNSGDGVQAAHVRSVQRLFAALADAALAGEDSIGIAEDSPARAHLLDALSLRETKRDHLAFYHDVLRDWAVGMRLHEDGGRVSQLDLTRPVSPLLSRGIEFAGRLAIERDASGQQWLALLAALSPPGSHGSWRRHALMAILRSEHAAHLLDRHAEILLRRGGALLAELTKAIVAADTISAAELFAGVPIPGLDITAIGKSIRTAASPSAPSLLAWCINHAAQIPMQGLPAVVRLAEILLPLAVVPSSLSRGAASMLFGWLLQLDLREHTVTIPVDDTADRLDSDSRSRLIEDLRSTALLLAASAPEATKAYLAALCKETDRRTHKAVLPFSQTLARVAPAELAALVEASLVEPPRRKHCGAPHDRCFSFADTDYMPPSPAQPPFLHLLQAAPSEGLALIRRLTEVAIACHAQGTEPGDDGFTLAFDEGDRFFPWVQSYFWSRGQGNDYAVASGLMALEAWAHLRLDADEPIDAVLKDILGPEDSCTAYLMIALDVLISHWPKTRDALVPFAGCPALIGADRDRMVLDQIPQDRFWLQTEPAGPVRLEGLKARGSRGVPLERVLLGYLGGDAAGEAVRARLVKAVAELGAYREQDDFSDPAFMGAHALNLLDPANWQPVEEGHAYQPPLAEAQHLAELNESRGQNVRASGLEAEIQLAANDHSRASLDLARRAAEHAAGELPDVNGSDYLKTEATRVIAAALLVARDGDESLLEAHEAWVRKVIARALIEQSVSYASPAASLFYNRPAMAICALAHLWHRHRSPDDRDALIGLAMRTDRSAPAALTAALAELTESDPRMIKSVTRVGIGASRWRWHPYDEDDAAQRVWMEEKATADQTAVAAEIAWLEGGAEPDWPQFPEELPHVRASRSRVAVVSRDSANGQPRPVRARTAERQASVHADSQSAAAWLWLTINAEVDWAGEVVDAYSEWSAYQNGFGLDADAEIDRAPDEWNRAFYALSAPVMMTASEQCFDQLSGYIVGLPDRPFGDVAETLLHAADVWYFNNARQSAARPVALRERLGQRTRQLRRWGYNLEPGRLSIDLDTGGVVAKLLMNTHEFAGATKCYLVPAVFDRLDPLLSSLTPLQSSGPTPFIALCTMNLLLVAPRARHAEFLLAAAEAWLERSQSDAALWTELGIGKRIVEWLEVASVEEPGLLDKTHPLRGRIDAVLGRLVAFGVAEAHELEVRVLQGGQVAQQPQA